MNRPLILVATLLSFLLGASCSSNDEDNTTEMTDGDTESPDNEVTDGDDGTDGDELSDGDEDGVVPYWVAPDRTGPFHIGARSVTFVGQDGERELPGVIWYPTHEQSGEPYKVFGIYEHESVFMDVAPATEGPFPVVVFSHGNSGFGEQSTYLTEFLASHGFVVATCDHIGNTLTTFDGAILGQVAQQRPRDLSLVIDELTRMTSDETDPLFGALNLDAIGVAGHSFGGTTALYVAGAQLTANAYDSYCTPKGDDVSGTFCSIFRPEHIEQLDFELDVHDVRVKAIVAQTPAFAALFGAVGLSSVAVPTMIQAGDADETLPYDEESLAAYAALNPPKYLFLLHDAGHFTFSDMCTISSDWGDGCGEAFLSPDTALPWIKSYILAFFRYHLLGESRDAPYLSADYAESIPALTWQSEQSER